MTTELGARDVPSPGSSPTGQAPAGLAAPRVDPSRVHDLLPCGNCGAPARWVERAWRIKCTRPSCGIVGGKFERRSDAVTAWETRSGPKVHHLGVVLQFIADEHADVLTPRQIKALYMAAALVWDRDSDGNPKGGDGTAPSPSDDSAGPSGHRQEASAEPTPQDNAEIVERVAKAIVRELASQDGYEDVTWITEDGKLAFLDQGEVDMFAVARAAIRALSSTQGDEK